MNLEEIINAGKKDLDVFEEDREVTPEVIMRLREAIRGSGAMKSQGKPMTPKQARAYLYLALCVAGLDQRTVDECMYRAKVYMTEYEPDKAYDMALQLFRQRSNDI
ncbi:hypothetical protein [Thermoactinomyces sp. DSM 45892]|uniref:hypothetical protein n=1 Tax=Thermoactinomyces sp. DSM 45892 TaxID=1882753 RepID=UPI000897F26D|nr:hypothetical protein [Thermoactinomyces sp. DSM 45892]SDY86445.1 hypothetical protein SAMN05444416_109109 [Thermoactinomyces sp. DSM 45892]